MKPVPTVWIVQRIRLVDAAVVFHMIVPNPKLEIERPGFFAFIRPNNRILIGIVIRLVSHVISVAIIVFTFIRNWPIAVNILRMGSAVVFLRALCRQIE